MLRLVKRTKHSAERSVAELLSHIVAIHLYETVLKSSSDTRSSRVTVLRVVSGGFTGASVVASQFCDCAVMNERCASRRLVARARGEKLAFRQDTYIMSD